MKQQNKLILLILLCLCCVITIIGIILLFTTQLEIEVFPLANMMAIISPVAGAITKSRFIALFIPILVLCGMIGGIIGIQYNRKIMPLFCCGIYLLDFSFNLYILIIQLRQVNFTIYPLLISILNGVLDIVIFLLLIHYLVKRERA